MACRGIPAVCVTESIGEACTKPGECTQDEVCMSGSCAPLPLEGETCETTCADRLSCVEGSCLVGLARGEPCSSGEECVTGNCISGRCADAYECQ